MILVLADITLAATRSAACAASALGEVHVLAPAHLATEVATIAGVSKVLSFESKHMLAEEVAPVLASLAGNYSHVITAATTSGKDILPRAAALLDVAQISDVIQIISADTFLRPFYAGNALETVQSTDVIKLLTVRQAAFAAAPLGGSAPIETVPASSSALSSFVSADENKSERPELASARVVVSGGRGMGSAEDFKKLEPLADSLGAAIGASRAAVDSGFISNDHQVGQTGKVVAPELYVAVGISGAIQHLAGMKDSKVIVAINKDENAAIFDVADYGLVMTWQDALPQLLEHLKK